MKVVAAAFVLCVVGFATWVIAHDDSPDQSAPAVAPGEYLYLDNDRVRAYLGQIEGGLSQREERRITQSNRTNAGLSVPQASVAGSTQRDTYVRRVVTPDDADRFYTLREDLRIHGWLHELDASRQQPFLHGVAKLHPGDFVEINGGELRIPSFAAVFAKANYAEQLVAPHQRRVPRRLLAPITTATRIALADYIAHVGRDPRLPFRVAAPQSASGHVRVLLPLRASRLGYQPGLASGAVQIVAKVVRTVPAPHDGDSRRQRLKESYLDIDTVTSFGRALQRADRVVLKRLHIVRDHPTLGIRPIVTRAARVTGPGLVLLPIAVYK